MPSTPTTKSQVQAYKFVIRRMQSALVRKDAVMLHDPMRTHVRATYVGVALGALGIAAFFIVALFSNSPATPTKGIVISEETGQIYVLNEKPRYLTPVFNMASARLLLLAQAEKANQGGQSGNVSPPPEATVVKEEFLQGIRKQRKTGILDGPEVLPGPDSPVRARGKWGVCDNITRDPTLNQPTEAQKTVTTAFMGPNDFGKGLVDGQGALVQTTGQTPQTYLIYRTPPKLGISGSNAVRARVDLSKQEVETTFNPKREKIRTISPALLNAIPEVNELRLPDIPQTELDGGPPAPGLPNPGTVISVTNVGTTNYLVLHSGLRQIPPSAAKMYGLRDGQPVSVQANVISGVSQNAGNLPFDQFPTQPPALLPEQGFPVLCLDWQADTSDPQFPKQRTEFTAGTSLPIDPKSKAPINPDDAVDVGTANADGLQIDRFWMSHGKAAVVHSATGPRQFDSGPIYIVTDRGVRYSVPDMRTAIALGVATGRASIDPAPDSIVRLLPGASVLSVGLVNRTFDAVGVPDAAGRLTALPPKPTVGNDGNAGNPQVPGANGGSAP